MTSDDLVASALQFSMSLRATSYSCPPVDKDQVELLVRIDTGEIRDCLGAIPQNQRVAARELLVDVILAEPQKYSVSCFCPMAVLRMNYLRTIFFSNIQ